MPYLQTTWQASPWEVLRRVALHIDCADIVWLQEMHPNHWYVKMVLTNECIHLKNGPHVITFSFTFSKQFREDEFTLRDPNSHDLQCAEAETSSDASKEYGVNRNSILNELR